MPKVGGNRKHKVELGGMLGGTSSWAGLLGSVGYQNLPKKGFPPSI